MNRLLKRSNVFGDMSFVFHLCLTAELICRCSTPSVVSHDFLRES